MGASEAKGSKLPKAPKLPPGQFPEPLIVSPKLGHRQTFIILHGRGRVGSHFGPQLLETATSSNLTIQAVFPHAKFIFPTASRGRAKVSDKYTHQWMVSVHGNDFTEQQDLMAEGLKKSCTYIQDILRREIDIIGEKNVVLWGMSQGAATSLSSLLVWDGKPFAAVVLMCGYLPFWNHIRDIASGSRIGFKTPQAKERFDKNDISGSQGASEVPFAHSVSEDDNNGIHATNNTNGNHPMEAITFFRNKLDVKEAGTAFKAIPIFMGHGTEDLTVPVDQGRNAKAAMDLIGADARLVEYQGLGHWYSADMLEDILNFLREKLV